MKINFANHAVNYAIRTRKNSQTSFKGIDNDDNDKCQGNKNSDKISSNEKRATLNPAFQLKMQLLNDGITKDQIDKKKIFQIRKMADVDIFDPSLLKHAQDGSITDNDIFSYEDKTSADIQSMQRVYTALKGKFFTMDVLQHVNFKYNFEKKAAPLIPHIVSHTKEELCNNELLEVLRHVTQDNETLILELLNDDNFDNTEISDLFKTGFYEPEYMLKTLKLAQEIGYPKEFSNALSVLIREANEKNFPMIQKMLTEQEFLIEDPNYFTGIKLPFFLKEADSDLAREYVADPQMTLETIDERYGLDVDDDEDWSFLDDEFDDPDDED